VRPLGKLLIANRGEIAVRIARTARAMGLPTVAVFSEADARARHVRECDEAVPIGPAEPARSYLRIDALLEAARRTGAGAVHPGYGFLSQNGDFADAVNDAGLVFVGPPGDVHRRMGDKMAARRMMAAAGVPVAPGYDGADQQDVTLLAEAERIGWPVMIKPSRGGGGKGMRVVERREGFAGALAASRREAVSAFGSDAMVLERRILRPRHVEVQVLADAEGQVLHLFERECSIQRRHQKIVEETPSPALTPAQRRDLCVAGVQAARAVGYRNAGTVEFLLEESTGRFYFLEMNTRLQVEHAVTEAVTQLDIVRLQLEVAGGRPLGLRQEGLRAQGHALECRLYAEDPDKDDLPSPGRILHYVPPEGPGVRFDSGIEAGSEIAVNYDPLLAKLVTWGHDRGEALARMREALRGTVVLGVVTNLKRLHQIVAHPAFVAGALHTGFIDEHLEALTREPPLPDLVLSAVAVALTGRRGSGVGAPSGGANAADDATDPFDALGGWRLGG
jgi:3-methylcrotonyl-CoA carboxylase alpha subunit